MTPPLLAWQSFHLPKTGNTADEYEDAFAGAPEAGRFAVADGASESSFAGAWAQMLVDGFVKHSGPWSRWLRPARADWLARFVDLELPWYAEAKLEEGAHATLLGFSLETGPGAASGIWRAESVGDTCLFHIREQSLLRSFPVRKSEEFNNQPPLVGSYLFRDGKTPRRRIRGQWIAGDKFLLMTDALAAWFVVQTENGAAPWQEIECLTDQQAFEDWISRLRESQELRNDDVTLVKIAILKENKSEP